MTRTYIHAPHAARRAIPAAPSPPVAHLAAGFGDVTNAYKFYWLLTILAHVQAHRGGMVEINTFPIR